MSFRPFPATAVWRANGLKLLGDPKAALPPYDAVLLLSPRRAGDSRFRAALKPLVNAIPLNVMQQANLMVDQPLDKKTPAQTAHWLEQHIPH